MDTKGHVDQSAHFHRIAEYWRVDYWSQSKEKAILQDALNEIIAADSAGDMVRIASEALKQQTAVMMEHYDNVVAKRPGVKKLT